MKSNPISIYHPSTGTKSNSTAKMANLLQEELDVKFIAINLFSDSEVDINYLYNATKRFYIYVHNKEQQILQSTKPDQCFLPASHLEQTKRFFRSLFLRSLPTENMQLGERFELTDSVHNIKGCFFFFCEKHPIVFPKDSYVSLLLTRHHHEQVKHQGLFHYRASSRTMDLGWQGTHKFWTLQLGDTKETKGEGLGTTYDRHIS